MWFACIQTSKRTSFEKFFHLDYFTFVRTANSPRLLYLAASWLVAWWFLGGELVGGETPWWRDDRIPWQGIEAIKHIHIWYTSSSPLPENQKDENRKMWKLKDVKIVAAEISLINSVPVRIKFSRVLRTVTGSEPFSVLTCQHTTTFTLLSIYTPLETSSTSSNQRLWEYVRRRNFNTDTLND